MWCGSRTFRYLGVNKFVGVKKTLMLSLELIFYNTMETNKHLPSHLACIVWFLLILIFWIVNNISSYEDVWIKKIKQQPKYSNIIVVRNENLMFAPLATLSNIRFNDSSWVSETPNKFDDMSWCKRFFNEELIHIY